MIYFNLIEYHQNDLNKFDKSENVKKKGELIKKTDKLCCICSNTRVKNEMTQ